MTLREEILICIGRMTEDEAVTQAKMDEYDVNHPFRIMQGGYLQGVRRWRIALQNLIVESSQPLK